MGFKPTDEQQAALDLHQRNESFLINALAGTGKTETVVQMAASTPNRRVQVTAFNKAIVLDVDKRLPRNAEASTLHALANRATGRRFTHRFSGGRVKSSEYARILGVQPLFLNTVTGRRVLQKDFVASLAVQTAKQWCQSADPVPNPTHVPFVDGVALEKDRYANQDLIRSTVVPHAVQIARHLMIPDDPFPVTTDLGFASCVKSWQMYGSGNHLDRRTPIVQCDTLAVDEAQDVSEVMGDIIARQDCQVVCVGDPNQSIFQWLGLIDLFDKFADRPVTPLTKSWRFGPGIADLANEVLAEIGTDLRLVGGGSETSRIGQLDAPRAVLCRTNATAIRQVLEHQRAGNTTHLVGDGTEVAAFARGAEQLMKDGWTYHHELRPFGSWNEVLAYCEHDPAGGELALLVKLVEDFGVDTIKSALDTTIPAEHADVIVTTVHKSKGLGFESVKIADDFAESPSLDEWQVLYVAATRAKEVLDLSLCQPLLELNGYDTGERVVRPAPVVDQDPDQLFAF